MRGGGGLDVFAVRVEVDDVLVYGEVNYELVGVFHDHDALDCAGARGHCPFSPRPERTCSPAVRSATSTHTPPSV